MTIWPGRAVTKKFKVKMKSVKLEGLKIEDREKEIFGIEIKWQGQGPPKSGFSSLYRKTHQAPSKEIKFLKLGEEDIDDDDKNSDEFVSVCSFSVVSKNPISFAPWTVIFNILSGKNEESSSSPPPPEKMQVIGKVKLNLGELASKMEAQIEQKIPVALQVDGVPMEATLRVVVNFIEMKNSSHSRTISHDLSGVSPSDSAFPLRRAMSQGLSQDQEKSKKSKIRLFGRQWSSKNSDESTTTVSSDSEYVVVASSSKTGDSNSVTELGRPPSSEAQLDLVKKGGFWKWKRRRSKNKADTLNSNLEETEKRGKSGSWEARELVSRDGKTKLKADVFLASYDQRDEKAAGESACAAIVAVIAHWLQSNPGMMPTGPELDRLITEGSSEWRKLCEDDSHKEFFPNQHFDLETILQAELRPLAVLPGNSLFGFFHPEEFEHLKDALSFDDIWDKINTKVCQNESSVYIVSWNDHFFILKVEKDANYIIDSLGERLYEGCNQAYILKFDDSTVMYRKNDEEGGEDETKRDDKKREDTILFRGKECCREYMKSFLAAIPLRELKEEEEKGKTADVCALLYQKLQIEFHLSTPSSSASSTANTSVSASPNTSPENCLV